MSTAVGEATIEGIKHKYVTLTVFYNDTSLVFAVQELKYAFQEKNFGDFVIILNSGTRYVFHGSYVVQWS